jgi:hypothetical protein
MSGSNSGPRSDTTTPLEPRAVENVAERYVHWLEAAERYLALQYRDADVALQNVKRQKPAHLTDEWLRLIADEFQRRTAAGQKAVTAIADAHHVQKSTASRWVTRARERGFLPADTKRKRGDHA